MVNNQDKIIALLWGSGPTSKTAQNSALSFPLFPIFNPHFSPLLASILSAYLLCYFHAPLLNRCFPSSFITPVTHFPHNQRLSSHCLSSPLHSLFQLSVFVSPYWMLGQLRLRVRYFQIYSFGSNPVSFLMCGSWVFCGFSFPTVSSGFFQGFGFGPFGRRELLEDLRGFSFSFSATVQVEFLVFLRVYEVWFGFSRFFNIP